MKHPGHQNKEYPPWTVLQDLAAQEGCDGEPYDQMQEAADMLVNADKLLEFFCYCMGSGVMKITCRYCHAAEAIGLRKGRIRPWGLRRRKTVVALLEHRANSPVRQKSKRRSRKLSQ